MRVSKNIIERLKQVGASLALVVLLLSAANGHAQAAGTGTLTLSPGSGSYASGANLGVEIFEDSGTDATNAIEADLTYNQSALQFVSIDTTAAHSAFDLVAPTSGSNGSVKVPVGKAGTSLTGQQQVALVNFKVLAASGSSAITFASNSAIVRASDAQNVWISDQTGGTYNFTAASPTSATSAKANASSSPGATTATTTGGTAASYYVAVKVVGANKEPIEDAKVTLANQSAITDKTGVASFNDIRAGTYTASVVANKHQTNAVFAVANTNKPQTAQAFTVKLAGQRTTYGYVDILSLVILLSLGVWLIDRKRGKSHGLTSPAPDPTTANSVTSIPNPMQSKPPAAKSTADENKGT